MGDIELARKDTPKADIPNGSNGGGEPPLTHCAGRRLICNVRGPRPAIRWD